jgi:Phage protein (N4 Gp49/phage Sf6 gene 66) family
MSENTVTQEQIDNLYDQSVVTYQKMGSKTLVTYCETPKGFVIVEYASCVDPANFDEKIGMEICEERIKNKLWELEGYKLQDNLKIR